MVEQTAKSSDDAPQKDASLTDHGKQPDQKESTQAEQEVKPESEPAPAANVQEVQEQAQKVETSSEQSKREDTMADDAVAPESGPGGVQPVVVEQQATVNPTVETANPPPGVDLSVGDLDPDESKDESQAEQQSPVVVSPEAAAPVAAVEMPVEEAQSLDVFDVAQTGDADIDDPTKTDEDVVASGDADASDPVKPAPDNQDTVASGDADASDPVKPAPQAAENVLSGDGDVSDPSKSGDADGTDPVKPDSGRADVAKIGDPDIDGPTQPAPLIEQPQGPAPTVELEHDGISIEEPTSAGFEPFQQVVAPEAAIQTEDIEPGDMTIEGVQPENSDEDESSKPETSDAPAVQDLQNGVGTDAVDPFNVKDASTDGESSAPPTDFGDDDAPFDAGLPGAEDVKQSITDQLDPAAHAGGQGGLAGIADVASGGSSVTDQNLTKNDDGSTTRTTEFSDGTTLTQTLRSDGSYDSVSISSGGDSVLMTGNIDGSTGPASFGTANDDGSSSIITLDPSGGRTETDTSADGTSVSERKYDEEGNLTASTHTEYREDGSVHTETAYPEEGTRVVTHTDANGFTVKEYHFSDGSVREVHSDGTVIDYDADGNVTNWVEAGSKDSDSSSDDESESSEDESSDSGETDEDPGTDEAPDSGEEEEVDSYDENYVSPDEAIARFGDSYIRMKEAVREGSDVTPTPDGVESAEASGPPIWFTEGVSDPPDDGPSAPSGDPALDEPMVAGDDAGAIDFGPDHVDEDQPELNDPDLTSDAASQTAAGDASDAGQPGSMDPIDEPIGQIVAGAQEIHDEIWDSVESALETPSLLDPDNPVLGLTAGLPGIDDEDDDQDDDV